jgi:hypothetical protein
MSMGRYGTLSARPAAVRGCKSAVLPLARWKSGQLSLRARYARRRCVWYPGVGYAAEFRSGSGCRGGSGLRVKSRYPLRGRRDRLSAWRFTWPGLVAFADASEGQSGSAVRRPLVAQRSTMSSAASSSSQALSRVVNGYGHVGCFRTSMLAAPQMRSRPRARVANQNIYTDVK